VVGSEANVLLAD